MTSNVIPLPDLAESRVLAAMVSEECGKSERQIVADMAALTAHIFRMSFVRYELRQAVARKIEQATQDGNDYLVEPLLAWRANLS